MALAIGIWCVTTRHLFHLVLFLKRSLKLTPGKVETFQPPADLKITNVALGDVLKDASGRTTVKLTFEPSGVLDDEDEDEVPKTVTTVLCSLKPDTLEQTSVNLILQEDETYKFELAGKNTVYLTGNYIEQAVNNPPFDDDDSDLDSEEDAYDLREVSSDVEMHPDDLDDLESDASRFEEVEEAPKNLKRAREADEEAEKPSKAEKKKKQKTEVAQPADATPEAKKKKEKEPSKEKGTPNDKEEKSKGIEKEIAGGIKILDAKVGTGPLAKKGNTVRVRYIGKLTNGKIFDKNVKGKPLAFQLGKGEVIKGWDEGVVGMQVGGERKLTIPPAMGYGSQAIDKIPKNSTLVFEVKLLEIKQ
ncbi:FK506-binding protein [Termitomyces sp. J132]|nr:FK506-binding protein [Termitomyces sp. J132]